MRANHRKTRDELVSRMLHDPMPLLQELMAESAEWSSSNEVGAETGVPGSVVRSIRNGSVGDVKASTLAPLLRWGLAATYPESFPELRGG